jgi:excisionase family DNA binding protein
LESQGWCVKRFRVSHQVLRHPSIPDAIPVRVHGNQSIKLHASFACRAGRRAVYSRMSPQPIAPPPSRVVLGRDEGTGQTGRPGGRSPSLEELMTADQVARLLLMPTSTVRDYARRGVLPSIKLGKHRRFVRSHVEGAIEALVRAPR